MLGPRKRMAAVVAMLAAVGGFAQSASAGQPAREDPFNFGNPVFCASAEPVEDFGLSELPPVHEAPPLGDLPFGPKTVDLDLAGGKIVTPGESVGFWLHSENYFGRTPLHWVLRHRIRRLGNGGAAAEITARERLRVRLIRAAREIKSFLAPPRAPGFYLEEIEIVEFGGRRLARYGRHVKVEKTFWDARLSLNRQRFRPGNRVLSRVDNFGTVPIGFGEEFRLQAFRGGSWTHIRNPVRGWLLWLGYAGAGYSGRCSAVTLPKSFPAGRYRIVKEVGAPPWPSDDAESKFLTAEFNVVRDRR